MNDDQSYEEYYVPNNCILKGTMLGGLLSIRNMIETLVVTIPILVIIISSTLSATSKLFLCVFFGALLVVFGSVGIDGGSYFEFFGRYKQWRKRRRIIRYNPKIKNRTELETIKILPTVGEKISHIKKKYFPQKKQKECEMEYFFKDDIKAKRIKASKENKNATEGEQNGIESDTLQGIGNTVESNIKNAGYTVIDANRIKDFEGGVSVRYTMPQPVEIEQEGEEEQ